MDTQHNKRIVFKQSVFEVIVVSFLVPIVFAGFVFMVDSTFIHFVFVYILLFALVQLYYYYTFKTYTLDESGLAINNRLGTQKIRWQDVDSMSTVIINDSLRYEIKTKSATVSIPLTKNFSEIEKFISVHSHLELMSKVRTPTSLIFPNLSPGLERWKKNGREYVHTSWADWFFDMYFSPKYIIIFIALIFLIDLVVFLLFKK